MKCVNEVIQMQVEIVKKKKRKKGYEGERPGSGMYWRSTSWSMAPSSVTDLAGCPNPLSLAFLAASVMDLIVNGSVRCAGAGGGRSRLPDAGMLLAIS